MAEYTPSRAWTDEEARKFTAPCADRHQWDAWLAAHDARVRRDAWFEGYETGFDTQYGGATPGGYPYDPDQNPYKQEDQP